MIIKVKQLNKNEPIEDLNCWVFDGIERITYLPKAVRIKDDNQYFRVITISYPKKPGEEISKEFLRINIFYLDERRQTTVLNIQNCVVFLCNDEGKTFDKLTC